MFFLWVKTISIKKINRSFELVTWIDIKFESMLLMNSLIEFITRTVKDEKIDDIDEYLKIKAITIQVNINSKNSWIDKAPITPR